MKVDMVLGGILDPAYRERWIEKKQESTRTGVRRGIQQAGPKIAAAVKANAAAGLKMKSPKLLGAFRYKIYADNPAKLPTMLIGRSRKVPWIDAHEFGATVRSRNGKALLIPINYLGSRSTARPGYKRFKAIVQGLLRTGNAFFKEVNGKVLLFAENIRENQSQLVGFKRSLRQSTGAKRIKRGTEIPIAVLMPAVRLKKRIDVLGTVKRNLGLLARAIEKELG